MLEGPSHQSSGTRVGGWSCTLSGVCFTEIYQVLTVKIKENSPQTFSKGREKLTILKYIKAFCSNYQDLDSRETILPEPKLLKFYQSPIN